MSSHKSEEEIEEEILEGLCKKMKIKKKDHCNGWACCGCSGFGSTYPDLRGCCSTSCPCPECYSYKLACAYKKIRYPGVLTDAEYRKRLK